jgi:hypothetical protein
MSPFLEEFIRVLKEQEKFKLEPASKKSIRKAYGFLREDDSQAEKERVMDYILPKIDNALYEANCSKVYSNISEEIIGKTIIWTLYIGN